MAHWLLKTEPSGYSIDDLAADGVACWEGVRSPQARDHLRAMRVGELAFFYHSSAQPPGVVGVCEVVREAYPDHHAWDPSSPYHDPRSTPGRPLWFMPDVRFVEKLPRMVTLAELRRTAGLEGMVLLHRPRLSVQPVTEQEWKIVEELARS